MTSIGDWLSIYFKNRTQLIQGFRKNVATFPTYSGNLSKNNNFQGQSGRLALGRPLIQQKSPAVWSTRPCPDNLGKHQGPWHCREAVWGKNTLHRMSAQLCGFLKPITDDVTALRPGDRKPGASASLGFEVEAWSSYAANYHPR